MEDFGKEISLTEAMEITGAKKGQVTGFIFDLKLVEDFIASARETNKNAQYLLAIKAQNPAPDGETLVVTAAVSNDQKTFTVVLNRAGRALEHPNRKGSIHFEPPTTPDKTGTEPNNVGPVVFSLQ